MKIPQQELQILEYTSSKSSCKTMQNSRIPEHFLLHLVIDNFCFMFYTTFATIITRVKEENMKQFVLSYKTKIIPVNRRKELYTQFKSKQSCCHCGYDLSTYALQFHHIYSEHKEAEVSKFFNQGDVYKILSELEKCVVLCANCHSVYHNTQDTAWKNQISMDFKIIDTKPLVKAVTKLKLQEIVLQDFEEESESNILKSLTIEQQQEAKRVYEVTQSLKKTSIAIFGDGKFGKFYNDILRQYI